MKMRKCLAMLLGIALLLNLAACGGKNDDAQQDGDTRQLSGTAVYAPTYKAIKELSDGAITAVCMDGDTLLLSYQNRDETTQMNRCTLYRVSMEGDIEKVPDQISLDENTANTTVSLSPGPDGTVWAAELRLHMEFDLPEHFDERADSKWNYRSGYARRFLVWQLDAAGEELSAVDMTETVLDLEERTGGSCQITVDKEGNCYLACGGEVTVLDKNGGVLVSLAEASLLENQAPIRLANGLVGVACKATVSSPEGDADMYTVREVDLEKKAWGKTYELSHSPAKGGSCIFYDGSRSYLFCVTLDQYLYGWELEEGGAKRLFSWLAADISPLDVNLCTFLPDGRVAALARIYVDSSLVDRLAILTKTEGAYTAEREILTYAGIYIPYDRWQMINNFNHSQDQYYIQAKDYGAYNSKNDIWGGYTLLLTEIGAGKVPDIIDTQNLPMRQMAAKGLLEDLWPYIDNDPELGRDALMTHVLEADQVNGGLYEVFDAFAIETVAGASTVVGDRVSWTFDDFWQAMERMPAGCSIFYDYDTQAATLLNLMQYSESQYIDWTTGECFFDGENFKSLLAMCKELPANFDWSAVDTIDSQGTKLREGRQMLTIYSIGMYGFDDIGIIKELFGDEQISLIGYPTVDGSVGSRFSVWQGSLAISSVCPNKEGAWSFVRQILLAPEDDENDEEMKLAVWSHINSGFPVNKALFEAVAAYYMNPNRMIPSEIQKEAGITEEQLWQYAGYGEDYIVIKEPVTQEEYDQFMELYYAVGSVGRVNKDVRDIVLSQAAPYFAGDATLEDTAAAIQSRVKLYVNEQR